MLPRRSSLTMLKNFIRPLIPETLIGAYHYVLARLAAFWFRYPSQELIVIGVTGTNGKTRATMTAMDEGGLVGERAPSPNAWQATYAVSRPGRCGSRS